MLLLGREATAEVEEEKLLRPALPPTAAAAMLPPRQSLWGEVATAAVEDFVHFFLFFCVVQISAGRENVHFAI